MNNINIGGWCVMILDSVFLGLVLTIIVLCGFKILLLPTSVLNTLLATTTIEVIGLAYIILHGLFDTKYYSKNRVKATKGCCRRWKQ